MGEWSAGFIGKDVDQLLELDLESFSSIVIFGQVLRTSPDVLRLVSAC